MELNVNLIKKYFPNNDYIKEFIDIKDLEKKDEVF